MIKKMLIAAALLIVCAGCKPRVPETPKMDVGGCWELSSVATKVNVAGEQVSVYLDLAETGSFSLYQKIGAGRYTVFSGSWTLDQDAKQLSGSYQDGTSWGPYDCEVSETTLTLSFVGGSEVDTYTKIDEIPSSVTENVY